MELSATASGSGMPHAPRCHEGKGIDQMKRMWMGGLIVVAALALCGLASAGASAALPELGRCVPASTAKTGEYKGAHCLTSARGKGNYNFLPGPGEKKKFVGTGSEAKLEMPGLTVSCAASTSEGEYTGAKTASVTLDLIGCSTVATAQLCQSNPVKAGEIETLPLEGEFGFIQSGQKPVVALDVKRSPSLVTFTCGSPPESTTTVVVEGSVIGKFAPNDSMVMESKLSYKTAGGKQVVEHFEGGPKDTLSAKLISGLTTTTEEAALKLRLMEIANEEPLEIKAK